METFTGRPDATPLGWLWTPVGWAVALLFFILGFCVGISTVFWTLARMGVV